MAIPELAGNGWLPFGHFEAEWDELIERFGGGVESPRARVTARLLWLRDRLRAVGVSGQLLVDGSYISSAAEPHDVDVLLIADRHIESLKQVNFELVALLNPQRAERLGYSILYCPNDSPVLETVMSVWDTTDRGEPKGSVLVQL